MKFKTQLDVANFIWPIKDADRLRSENRALINSLANGDPPYTPGEQEENNINVNVNFLDLAQVAHDARNTFNNAFLKQGNFFNATCDGGPIYKKDKWGREFTRHINRIMKRSKNYMETLRSEFAQVVLHGVGPSIWNNEDIWCPSPIALQDLFIPTKTLVSLENLNAFGVYRRYTATQLFDMTHGEHTDPGWNETLVNSILAQMSKDTLQSNALTMDYTPEDIVELFKENGAYFDAESVPTVNFIDFYYYDEEQRDWRRKMIQDITSAPTYTANLVDRGEFVYEGKAKFAENLEQILHIMFADGANVAPFRYHSVRGLGWLLYAVCHLQNRLRCKFNDSVFEQMLWYFRVMNPQDRERLNMVDLTNMGIIPDGLEFVKGPERYTPNQALIESAFAKNSVNISQSAAQFRQGVDDGTRKEMTAAEVMARMNAANSLVGSMLNLAYTYQTYQYNEIVRRFCKKGSQDEDVKNFQKKCLEARIPEKYLYDHEYWQVEPERVLGAGNKTLEIAQADRLMAVRNLLNPVSQNHVLHMYVEANTDDPKLAENLVPLDTKPISDATHDAQLAAGALMQGLPVSMKPGLNHIDYTEALLNSMGAVLKKLQFQESSNMDISMDDIVGLQNLGTHIEAHIKAIAQDPNEKERVKRYGDALGNFKNLVKGFAQRLIEKLQAEQAQGDITPERAAEIKAMLIKAQTASQIKKDQADQKLSQNQIKFEQRMNQQAQTHQIDLGKKAQNTEVEIASKDALTAAEITRKLNEPDSQTTIP